MKFIQEAFDANWIAPYGPSLTRFEQEMANCVGVASALAVTSGTAGIHLALRYLNVDQGDIVFCSDLTFAGSCNPILYQNATPIFIDSEPESWNMSPIALQKAFDWAEKEGKPPKAVIIVDLYGESADYDALLPICRKYGVPVIEDAAEALGSSYKGKKCGSFGDIAVLSFNGNKILTTSGGGMVLSQNMIAIEKMRFWSTQAREPYLYYEHKEYGYNYRMSNICASIGLGQLTFLDKKIERRKLIHETYSKALEGTKAYIKEPCTKCVPNNWLSLLVLRNGDFLPDKIVMCLQNAEIEARLAWKPMHMQPVFQNCRCFAHAEAYVSEHIFKHAVCLPSGDNMNIEQQKTVIDELLGCL